MKKLMLLLFALPMVSLATEKSSASKEIFCYFTEPFITTIFNPLKSSLLVYDFATGESMGEAFLVKTEKSQTGYNLYDQDGILKLEIDTTKTGNDGMSDTVYSYEGIYHLGNQKLYGGCNLK